MSKVVDLMAVETGDVFTLEGGPSYTFRSSIYVNPSQKYFSFDGHWLCNYPTMTSIGELKSPYIKAVVEQKVRVLDAKEVPEIPFDVNSLSGALQETSGTDPEIFVTTGVEHKSLLPAFRFLPDKKVAYQKLALSNESNERNGDVPAYPYKDGFAAECYVRQSHCHGYLIDHIRAGLKAVQAAAKQYNRTASLTIENTFEIPSITMETATDEEVALGCKPSLNAYDDIPIQPADPKSFLMRFAGGHVHFGLPRHRIKDPERLKKMVKGIDLIAGVATVAMFESLDKPVRRLFYGRAGEYRLPPYGLEYRVLSNGWLAAPALAHVVLNLVRCGMKVGSAGYAARLGLREEETRAIINNCDVKAARKWVTTNYEVYRALLEKDGNYQDNDKAFRHLIEGGVEAVFPTFRNIAENWAFSTSWQGHSDNGRATWGNFAKKFASK